MSEDLTRAIAYATERAKKLKIPNFDRIEKSPRKNKKLRIIFSLKGVDGKIDSYYQDFGLSGSFTYADGASEQKRNAYRARASKMKNKQGEYTYKIPYTKNYLAYWLLWS